MCCAAVSKKNTLRFISDPTICPDILGIGNKPNSINHVEKLKTYWCEVKIWIKISKSDSGVKCRYITLIHLYPAGFTSVLTKSASFLRRFLRH